MQTRIEEREKMILAGVGFYGDPFSQSAGWTEENEIGRLWDRFMSLYTSRGGSMPGMLETDSMYEIHAWDERTLETGHYEVFVGYPIADVTGLPMSMVAKFVPSAKYAVFTLEGEVIRDEDMYSHMDAWISDHGYRRASWMYNRYDERYKGLDRIAESIIDVYLPIESI